MNEANEVEEVDEEPLFQEMRRAVSEGKSVRDVVHLIYDFHHLKGYQAHMVIRCLMEAFNLRLKQVQEVSAAKCVGASVHDDAEIDRILLPVLRESIEKKA